MKTLVIGRSPFADVVVAEASVAPHHAELVVTDDGRLHLTDCGSETGSWRQDAADGSGGTWTAVRQAFVTRDEPLRLGEYACTAGQLLAAEKARAEPAAGGGMPGRGGGDGPHRGLSGRVERDPVTGEVVRRRP